VRLSGGWRLLRFTLLFVIALSALLAIAGATYEAIASARDRRLYPPPGKLVDIGGRRLHIHCTGTGSPTVILDAGLGDPSLYWFLVQPEIAKFTRVCSYDRAGLGWSDPSPGPRTAHQIAADLDALLTRTVPPPYILVGHSGGGYFSRVYTSEHPDKVVGLVLVDSADFDEEEYQRFWTLDKKDEEDDDRAGRRAIALIPIGIPRMLGWCSGLHYDLPQFKPMLPALTAVSCRKDAFQTIGYEFVGFHNADRNASREVDSLKSLPMLVVSHDPARWGSPPNPPYWGQEQIIWDQMQEELSHLSPNSTRIVAKGSDHDIHVERPELVIQAVRNVYDAAVNGSPIKQSDAGGKLQ
jgi:pimeloyl-ACP methyl ester carboxylesterase